MYFRWMRSGRKLSVSLKLSASDLPVLCNLRGLEELGPVSLERILSRPHSANDFEARVPTERLDHQHPAARKKALRKWSKDLLDLEVERRIDAAAQYIDRDQLALSPQCGFASTAPGNKLTFEQQTAKLRRVVEVAREVWG